MEKVCGRQKSSITEVLGELGVMDRWVHRRDIVVQLKLGFSIPFFVYVINFDYLVRQLSAAE